jgi:hypothetical protein
MKRLLRILFFSVPAILAVVLLPVRLAIESWLAFVIIFGFLCSE